MVGSWCRYKNAPEGTIRVTVVRVNDGGTGAVDVRVAEPATCTCPECQDIRRRLERNPR
jgi:hypothetical protein